MVKENMTISQIIAIFVLFVFGSNVIIGLGGNVQQDTWISLLMAVIMVIPLILIYARICRLYPGKNLFDIIKRLFGKIIGTFLIVLMTWYALHLGALVVRNFTEYIEITSLFNTPQIVTTVLLLATCLYIGRSKMEILGKWGLIVLPIILSILIITVILSLNIININNLLPIMSHDIKDIFGLGLSITTFPFGEVVLFFTLADSIKKQDSSYKIYIYGILFGALYLLIAFLRNMSVLGPAMMKNTYFPSYMATRVIEIGDFLTRIEAAATINFVLAGITKITICLIAASRGISYLFNVKNYRCLILPTALIMLTLSLTIYTNVMEMFDFVKVYPIYAIPFQVLIPVIIWIVAERNVRKTKVMS